MVEEVKETDA